MCVICIFSFDDYLKFWKFNESKVLINIKKKSFIFSCFEFNSFKILNLQKKNKYKQILIARKYKISNRNRKLLHFIRFLSQCSIKYRQHSGIYHYFFLRRSEAILRHFLATIVELHFRAEEKRLAAAWLLELDPAARVAWKQSTA